MDLVRKDEAGAGQEGQAMELGEREGLGKRAEGDGTVSEG